MNKAICECGNKFLYITVNDKIQCKECNTMIDAIPIEDDIDGA